MSAVYGTAVTFPSADGEVAVPICVSCPATTVGGVLGSVANAVAGSMVNTMITASSKDNSLFVHFFITILLIILSDLRRAL
jgi:hypothetical protein